MQIIVPHTNTDMDALGAAVGAQILYPGAVIVLPGMASPVVAEFLSLHRYALKVVSPREINLQAVSRVIVVDTADPARLGPLAEVVRRAEVHLYDHHPPEEDDLTGSVQLRAIVGATCTLLAERLAEDRGSITPLQATVMLLGIYCDTGSLSLSNTTPRDAAAAAYLLSQGANLRLMARFLRFPLSPSQQALFSQLHAASRWFQQSGVQVRILMGETTEYVGGLAAVVHQLQSVLPARALIAVVKMGDRVHLVARSDVPWVNMAQAMEPFGGGGHAAAASAVVKGQSAEMVLTRLETILSEVVMRPLCAGDLMKWPVKTISASKSVAETERLMLRYGHSGLPVTGENGHLEGILSLRDVRKALRHGLGHAPVSSVMTRRVMTVGPEVPVDAVQSLMVEKDIGRIPVVQGGSMVGIISRTDLLGLLYGDLAPRWHRPLYAQANLQADDWRPMAVTELLQTALAGVPLGLRDFLVAAGAVADQIGVRAYAVGGFVRDLLLGRPNFDLDIVIEGDGLAYAQALGQAVKSRVQLVSRFGTAHLYPTKRVEGVPVRVDVSTARREFYQHAAALPIVEYAGLREDLYRRDFAINAMAIRLGAVPEELVDPFSGLADLKAGIVRILHTLSFVEDPTRIFRAIRFAHRYQFHLDPETIECAVLAIQERYLERVSMERLRTELKAILAEPHCGGALCQLAELGALSRILPAVSIDEHVVQRINRVEVLAAELPDLYATAVPWLVKLMLLLSQLGSEAGKALAKELKLRKPESRAINEVLSEWPVIREQLSEPDLSAGTMVLALRSWQPSGLLFLRLMTEGGLAERYWTEWRHMRLAISGVDLIRAGISPGPHIGRALDRVLADRVEGRASDYESQLALALRYIAEEGPRC